MKIIDGMEVDRRLAWPIGHAKKLAGRGTLPHIVLPDGEIRFRWEHIEPLIIEKLVGDHNISTGTLIEEQLDRDSERNGDRSNE